MRMNDAVQCCEMLLDYDNLAMLMMLMLMMIMMKISR